MTFLPEDTPQETRKVLMVDDDLEFQRIVKDWLYGRYEFLGLPGGKGLLEALADFQPDVVIMDVRMPGPNGFKLCRALRADSRFQSLPVLFLTGGKDETDSFRHLNADGTALLMKPVDRRQLIEKLRDLVRSAPASKISSS